MYGITQAGAMSHYMFIYISRGSKAYHHLVLKVVRNHCVTFVRYEKCGGAVMQLDIEIKVLTNSVIIILGL